MWSPTMERAIDVSSGSRRIIHKLRHTLAEGGRGGWGRIIRRQPKNSKITRPSRSPYTDCTHSRIKSDVTIATPHYYYNSSLSISLFSPFPSHHSKQVWTTVSAIYNPHFSSSVKSVWVLAQQLAFCCSFGLCFVFKWASVSRELGSGRHLVSPTELYNNISVASDSKLTVYWIFIYRPTYN
jgi:hypothetical protein